MLSLASAGTLVSAVALTALAPGAARAVTAPVARTAQGMVFRDFNGDSAVNALTEPGVGGFTVTATCVADTGPLATSVDDVYAAPAVTTTAADGRYSFGIALTAPAAWDAVANGAWAPPAAGRC